MSFAKKFLFTISFVFLSLVAIVLIRTFTLNVRNIDVSECTSSDADFIEVGIHSDALKRFREALRIKTVAREPHDYNSAELLQLVDYIIAAYPTVHESPLVQYEVVANLSLLYTVKGEDPTLTPYLLMAHLDVVPAEPEKWEADPFSADIIGDFVYARGTIDFKHGVMGILEALNYYVSLGRAPERGFYVAFGHDEEVTGLDGAKAISEVLWKRGVRKFEFIVDEGLTVTNQIIPGMTSQTALLERNPLPSMLGYGPERETFEHLAPYMQFPYKVVMCNLWLFKPVISWVMSRKPATNAIIRTVTAVTMFNAGIKINVNAPEATAYVNHRIHPAQSIQEVVDYDRGIINDERVQIKVIASMDPHPIALSGEEDFGYQTVKNSIRQIWNNTYVAPGTMIGNTDTKHYLRMTHNVYRFSPTVMYPPDVKRFHGDNERISIKNYEQAVNFYYHLMVNANKAVVEPSHIHGEL
ncbi:N-fatty-acyl-amino acid synthase/hydrolase PM20D1.2-like isoform X3 [Mya arenaria]|uniref:N-fatty-acyl-amino acid synthase/hydrolase PM20D1.2-like isoform X3 n=1 Tax=Mya arenaria TaxID=6604 RepID=UPI0022E55F59|nr:N-fatty-acyl-amino acid synthase/hydrolase PM20D1.2-like isoform X3 [Mya arenaria]